MIDKFCPWCPSDGTRCGQCERDDAESGAVVLVATDEAAMPLEPAPCVVPVCLTDCDRNTILAALDLYMDESGTADLPEDDRKKRRADNDYIRDLCDRIAAAD